MSNIFEMFSPLSSESESESQKMGFGIPSKLRYLSVCSGIEAASVAWHPLGWTPVGFSEFDPFASRVLKTRFPEVPNFGDMTKYKEWGLNEGDIDLLVGGTPCQAFSIAGLRKGLADPRGNLALVFLGIADHLRPRWILWENVPGVLSSNGGRDFGSLLGGLGELGYGFSYRVLDAQHFGVPQRRRRVFVVGYLGDWRRAASVLFESESLRRNPPKGRLSREDPAEDFEAGPGGEGGSDFGDGSLFSGTGPRRGRGRNGTVAVPADVSFTAPEIDSSGHVKFGSAVHTTGHQGDRVVGDGDKHPTLSANGGNNGGGAGALTLVREELPITFTVSSDNVIFKHNGLAGSLCASGIGFTQNATMVLQETPPSDEAAVIIDTPSLTFQTRGSNVSVDEHITGTLGTNSDRASGSAPMIFQTCGPDLLIAENVTGALRTNCGEASGSAPMILQETHDPLISFTISSNNVSVSQDGVAGTLCASGDNFARNATMVLQPVLEKPIAFTCKSDAGDSGDTSPTLRAMGHDKSHMNGGGQVAVLYPEDQIHATLTQKPGPTGVLDNAMIIADSPVVLYPEGVHPTLTTESGQTTGMQHNAMVIAHSEPDPKSFTVSVASNGFAWESDKHPTLLAHAQNDTSGIQTGIRIGYTLRRVTPTECERLQGFPDQHSHIPGASDANRYKVLGNSMAVPVMQWIGQRMGMVDAIQEGAVGGGDFYSFSRQTEARPEGPHEAPFILDRSAFNQGSNAKFGTFIEQSETMPTLVAKGPHAVMCRSTDET